MTAHPSKRPTLFAAFGVGVAAVGAIVAAAIVYEPGIEAVKRPSAASFSADEIRRGAELASIGDCIVCHTAEGGRPFAGSRGLATPFGTLYSDNITPDETTGIGNWSFEAFRRGMIKGVARDGSHLYPALPYEHFTRVEEADLRAIYAFLMTREPVRQAQPQNELLPGLGFRPLLAGWKFLFLRLGENDPDPAQSAEWNRGKYLVDGLGHCGGCHTPRNLLGAEKHTAALAGGIAEGWIAPPLDASNPSAGDWDQASLFAYLKTGIAAGHSAAGGPMAPVAEGLSGVNDTDVKAISVYIASLMQTGSRKPATSGPDAAQPGSDNSTDAAKLFAGACGGCHLAGAPMQTAGRPQLSTSSDLKLDDPRNSIQVILGGLPQGRGQGPYMPAFGNALTDRQIADLLAYARSQFTNAPPWPDLAAKISAVRKEDAQ